MTTLMYVVVILIVLRYHKIASGIAVPDTEISSNTSVWTSLSVQEENLHKPTEVLTAAGTQREELDTGFSESYDEDVTTSVTDDPPEHPLYRISQLLFLIVIPIITIMGLINNGLMLLVMQRPNQKHLSVSVFMSALAVSDTLVLLLDFINNWINYMTGVHLKSTSAQFCQIYNFLFTVVYTYSAWLVVCVSMERLIVVWYPLQAKSICTTRKSIIVVCIIPVLCAILHSYNFLIWEINDDGVCNLHDSYSYFTDNIYSWMNAVAYSYLPVAILIVSNSCIIYKLGKAGSRRKTMGAEKLEMMRITLTVVVICVSYIILTVPLSLFYAIVFSEGLFINYTPQLELGRTFILILGLTNHAINFLLYVITSSKIRHELASMFGRHTHTSASRSQASASTTGSELSTVASTTISSTL